MTKPSTLVPRHEKVPLASLGWLLAQLVDKKSHRGTGGDAAGLEGWLNKGPCISCSIGSTSTHQGSVNMTPWHLLCKVRTRGKQLVMSMVGFLAKMPSLVTSLKAQRSTTNSYTVLRSFSLRARGCFHDHASFGCSKRNPLWLSSCSSAISRANSQCSRPSLLLQLDNFWIPLRRRQIPEGG